MQAVTSVAGFAGALRSVSAVVAEAQRRGGRPQRVRAARGHGKVVLASSRCYGARLASATGTVVNSCCVVGEVTTPLTVPQVHVVQRTVCEAWKAVATKHGTLAFSARKSSQTLLDDHELLSDTLTTKLAARDATSYVLATLHSLREKCHAHSHGGRQGHAEA